MQEAAARASKQVAGRERQLVQEFKDKGLTITDMGREDFKKAVVEKVSFKDFGYDKADWDAIQALKQATSRFPGSPTALEWHGRRGCPFAGIHPHTYHPAPASGGRGATRWTTQVR